MADNATSLLGASALPSTSSFNESKLLELRSKAYIPNSLPEDFLKISLSEQQRIETQDTILAHRLQYGVPVQPTFNKANIRGRLQIVIFEARLTKNYGLVKMDPYIKININGKILETETAYGGGKNPIFNKTILCYLPKNVDSFVLEIFDEKQFTSDEQIAVLNYTFPDELFEGVPIDEWLPLSGRLGEQKEGNIHIQMVFTPIERLQREQQQRQQQQRQFLAAAAAVPPVNVQVPNNVQLPSSVNNVPQQPLYTEEDVKNMKEMFPSFDEEVIKSLFETNNGNKETTINMLLQLSN